MVFETGGRFRDTKLASIGRYDSGYQCWIPPLGDFRYWVPRLNTIVPAVSYELGTDIGFSDLGVVRCYNSWMRLSVDPRNFEIINSQDGEINGWVSFAHCDLLLGVSRAVCYS